MPKGLYDPSRYPNPSLQWHYRILQALALDEDIPDYPEDKTKPKYRQIDKRVGNETTEWGQILEKAYKDYVADNPDAATTGSKRTTSANGHAGGSATSKRIKTEPGQVISDEQMKDMYQKGKVNSMTVAQLKDFCTTKKLPLSGKKADIVERVEAYFESK